MEKRHKIEIAVALAVLIGLFVLLFFLLRAPQATTPTNTNTGTVPVSDTKLDVSPVDAADVPAQHTVSAQTIARNFVERFGSFSSETNYINVDDVMPLATEALQRRLQELADAARENASDTYYGVSTRAIIFTVEEESEMAITMRITTQREESIDSPANTSVRNQDIRLALVKDGDDWRVDSFTWLEE